MIFLKMIVKKINKNKHKKMDNWIKILVKLNKKQMNNKNKRNFKKKIIKIKYKTM